MAVRGPILRYLGHLPPQAGWALPLQVHPWHEFILVVRGRIETRIRDRTVLGGRGDALVYPAGAPHSERAAGGAPLETLFLAWSGSPPAPDWPPAVFDREGRIEHLFRWMTEAHPPRGRANAALLGHLLSCLLAEYARLAGAPESGLVLKVRRFAQARLADRLTLKDLAAAAGLSRFHFVRAFTDAAGETPMRFLKRVRVEAARMLVLRTSLPLKAVAARTGFADEFHFSRVFRSVTGTPPGALRRPARRPVPAGKTPG